MTDPAGVVVVGSLHHDIMVWASHRPAAGETVTGDRWSPAFGGKGGNQAIAAVRAGARVRMLGAVGDDASGIFLRQHLRQGGVDDTHVATLPGHPSGMSVAITDVSGDYGAVIVSGANLGVDPDGIADALWDGASMLILQNELPDAVNRAAATAARTHGMCVCLNAAPYRPLPAALEALVDILVVNALEAAALSHIPVHSLSDATEAARLLATRFPVAIVTAGGYGVAFAEREGSHSALPAERITVVGTHGAGDVFTGVLAASLAQGTTLAEAVSRANTRAARHVAGLDRPSAVSHPDPASPRWP